MAVNFFCGRLRKGGQIRRVVHDEEIPAGFSSQHAEGFRLEFTDNMLALGILPHAVFTLGVGYGSPLCGADTYGNNHEVLFAGFLQQGGGKVHGVFTITENHQSIGAGSGGALKALHCQFEHVLQVGAPVALPVAIDQIEGFLQGEVVVGKGDKQLCLAGEEDEADFIRRQCIYKYTGCRACLLQAGGGDILRLHGAGDIQRNNEVAPRYQCLCVLIAVEGACRCDNATCQCR